MEVGITVNRVKVTSHILHQIWLHIQGSKHQKYLQEKPEWDNSTWNSIDWKGLKSGFLSLGPLKWVKSSKSIHGWQKSKISPYATDSHKCPRCLEPNITQEHLLQCRHIGAHKKCYDLIFPMMQKIHQNKHCPVQEVFTKCIRSWLESPETSIPDVSSVHESNCDLLQKAISDKECIGWHLAMRGYLSKYWGLAVAANWHLEEKMTKVLYGCKRLYSKLRNSHTKCGSTGMRCYMTRNLNLLSNGVKCRKKWCNHKTICAGACLCGQRPLVFWCPSDVVTTKAFMIKTLMTHKCKNFGKQVQTTYHNWSDDAEPVLPTPTIHEDSNEWNPWADCICLAVYSDEPIEPMESSARGWLKNLTKLLALIRY
jgi:hypothetical protein